MAAALIQAYVQLEDTNGTPRSGAKAYTYTVGTTTPLTTYTDYALTPGMEHANPVVADSEGVFAPIYAPTTADVKITLKTSADVTIRTIERIPTTSTPTAGSIGTTSLADDAATNAKLANMATDRVKGRTTAGTGDPEDMTITETLDIVAGTPTKGDMLVRDTSAMARIAAVAFGQYLASNGAGALPTWVAGGLPLLATLTASASTSLETPVFDATKYSGYLIEFINISPATNGANPQWTVSTDGSTYLTTGTYGYQWSRINGNTLAGAGNNGTATAIDMADDISSGAGGRINGFAYIGNGTGAHGTSITGTFKAYTSGGGIILCHFTGSNDSTSLITRMKLAMDSGAFTGVLKIRGLPL